MATKGRICPEMKCCPLRVGFSLYGLVSVSSPLHALTLQRGVLTFNGCSQHLAAQFSEGSESSKDEHRLSAEETSPTIYITGRQIGQVAACSCCFAFN